MGCSVCSRVPGVTTCSGTITRSVFNGPSVAQYHPDFLDAAVALAAQDGESGVSRPRTIMEIGLTHATRVHFGSVWSS